MEQLKNVYTKNENIKDTPKYKKRANPKNEKIVTVRFSEADYENLEERAKAAGISKSEFIRMSVIGAAVKELSYVQKLVPVISECDTKINRLQHSIGGNKGFQKELQGCRNTLNHIKNNIIRELE